MRIHDDETHNGAVRAGDAAFEFFGDGFSFHRACVGGDDGESERWGVGGDRAVNFRFVKVEDFGAAAGEPGVDVFDFFAVGEREGIGERIGSYFGFIVVRNVTGFGDAESVSLSVGFGDGAGSGGGGGLLLCE